MQKKPNWAVILISIVVAIGGASLMRGYVDRYRPQILYGLADVQNFGNDKLLSPLASPIRSDGKFLAFWHAYKAGKVGRATIEFRTIEGAPIPIEIVRRYENNKSIIMFEDVTQDSWSSPERRRIHVWNCEELAEEIDYVTPRGCTLSGEYFAESNMRFPKQ